MCNVVIRWNEQENGTNKNPECAKHLQEHFNHEFQWPVLSTPPRNTFKRKILEAYSIKSLETFRNGQIIAMY